MAPTTVGRGHPDPDLPTLLTVLTPSPIPAADIEEQDPAYYHTGELAGSLRSNTPLPLFDAGPTEDQVLLASGLVGSIEKMRKAAVVRSATGSPRPVPGTDRYTDELW